MITCGTPSFLQASKKFSTFLRHLAMLSFGWKPEYHVSDRKCNKQKIPQSCKDMQANLYVIALNYRELERYRKN